MARSRGLTQAKLFARHLVKPSMLPAVTMAALIAGELMGGAIVTEEVFGRNGIGSVMYTAVSNQDTPVLQGIVALAAVVFVVVNLIADLLSPLLDPRVRLNGGGPPGGGVDMSIATEPTQPRPRRLTAAARSAFTHQSPPSVLLSFVVVLIVILWSLLPALFTSYSAVTANPADKFLGPSARHWFGTDDLGRDEFARVVYGARSSVGTAVVAVAIGLFAGGLIGLLAGFIGGWVDAVLGRLVDTLLAIPGFLLAVVVVTGLGFTTLNAAIATGIASVAIFARLMRAETLKVRHSVFVESSYLQGGSRSSVLFRHVLPNAYRSVVALGVLQLGNAIIVIAALAFLGYGSPPPASDWGLLVAAGQNDATAPWLVYGPAIVIVITVLSINRISRWLRKTS